MPCLKTSVSEFRAFSKLDESTLNKLLPLFELTRGRRSKKDKVGLVEKNKDKIAEICDGRPFVLDLTRDETNSNHEIKSFLDSSDGYKNWCDFIETVQAECPGVYPVLQNDPAGSMAELEAQIEQLSSICKAIAIRIGTDNYIKYRNDGYKEFLYEVFNLIREDISVIVIIDSEHVRDPSGKCELEESVKKATVCINDIFEVTQDVSLSNCTFFNLSSSFPTSINQEHSGDSKGEAPLYERPIYDKLIENTKRTPQVFYGDYACIYQFQKPVVSYNWVPRIDYPVSTEKCIYYRFRQPHGGYIKCATEMVNNKEYKRNKINCWGTEQIESTAQSNKKAGGSPSFWISVRSNVWMTRIANQS